MTLTIPDEVLKNACLTADDLRVEAAVMLYARKRLTMEQARKLAGLDQIAFQHALAERDLYLHFGIEDLEKDLKNLGWPSA